jgi:hypothetical protein
MQGFELVVAKGNTDEKVKRLLIVNPLLPRTHASNENVAGRRRDESSLLDWKILTTYVDDPLPQTACIERVPASTSDQDLLQLA